MASKSGGGGFQTYKARRIVISTLCAGIKEIKHQRCCRGSVISIGWLYDKPQRNSWRHSIARLRNMAAGAASLGASGIEMTRLTHLRHRCAQKINEN